MAEFVKKGAMGYSRTKEGYYDRECSHVILTRDEYTELVEENRRLKDYISREPERQQQAVNQVVQQKDEKFQEMQQKAKAHMRDLLAREEEAERKAAVERELNEQLLRITIERANAKRGIYPKKDNAGYIAIRSSQYNQRYKDGKKHIKEAPAYKTLLQSPYDASIPRNAIEDEIFHDLFKQDILKNIRFYPCSNGITEGQTRPDLLLASPKQAEEELYDALFTGTYDKNVFLEGKYEDNVGETKDDTNILYRIQLIQSFEHGFWEVELFHTREIGVPVPESMRKPQKGKRKVNN